MNEGNETFCECKSGKCNVPVYRFACDSEHSLMQYAVVSGERLGLKEHAACGSMLRSAGFAAQKQTSTRSGHGSCSKLSYPCQQHHGYRLCGFPSERLRLRIARCSTLQSTDPIVRLIRGLSPPNVLYMLCNCGCIRYHSSSGKWEESHIYSFESLLAGACRCKHAGSLGGRTAWRTKWRPTVDHNSGSPVLALGWPQPPVPAACSSGNSLST